MTGMTVNSELDLHHAASNCPNCGATVSGHFCHQCGQETVLHPPSAREFMHEFIGHYVALEGKLWKSLGVLLFRPGRLTLEYINGRRVPYVQPLRMYLTFSLIFFAVLKFSMHDVKLRGEERPQHGAPAVAAQAKGGAGQGREKTAAEAAVPPGAVHASKTDAVLKEDNPGEVGEVARRASAWVKPHNAHIADRIEYFGELPFEEKGALLIESFYHYAPYAIFFMMPFFALYLKVLYLGSGRRYGEHLLFALHTNAFAFLAMTLMVLIPDGFGLVTFLLWMWLAFYLPAAMRKVYGGSRKLTALRWLVLILLHQLTIGLAILGAVVFGVLH
ncbi:DUF3667 domain-containing protein [Herbaspirillum sp. SJZ107]|uniref:DUF3667 domain-containing protein n=1 Tax=Herbaspirillum sp. SJZ107 TaxID=2572881 RepID=UPI001172AE8C|nr:DUF3667 domain-containing protein [Herbaspirillum sp. SJZ107]TQK06854.1 uncharacterized protein DUF3667 [Herbaspirillum sp. SJZ107]